MEDIKSSGAFTVVIVGVEHRHQFGPCEAFAPDEQRCAEFADFLRCACNRHGVMTVAEEMCGDARAKWQIRRTVPEMVAQELGLQHVDCGPNQAERDTLGIRNEGDIRMEGMLNERPASETAKAVRREYDKREEVWLTRVNADARSPTLFVCGSDHAISVAEKARRHGMAVTVLVRQWDWAEEKSLLVNPRQGSSGRTAT